MRPPAFPEHGGTGSARRAERQRSPTRGLPAGACGPDHDESGKGKDQELGAGGTGAGGTDGVAGVTVFSFEA
jgi:hypothetical protein